MQSRPLPPFSVSLLEVPMMMFVPAGQHAALSPSATVTLKLQDPTLPAVSLAVQVSSRVPSGNWLPDPGEQTGLAVAPPLSVALVVEVAVAPLGLVQSVFTPTGHVSTGAVVSTMFTFEVHVPTAPWASVHVSVMVCGPGPKGPVALGVQVGVGPSGSNEPPSMSTRATVALHVESTEMVAFLHTATGGSSKVRSISSGPRTKPTPG